MAARIGDLMEALRGEVDRITTEKASEDKREELSGLLLDSIHKTLREIKMGAHTEDFQELTVVNFVVTADAAGYSTDTIRDFVQELGSVRDARPRRTP